MQELEVALVFILYHAFSWYLFSWGWWILEKHVTWANTWFWILRHMWRLWIKNWFGNKPHGPSALQYQPHALQVMALIVLQGPNLWWGHHMHMRHHTSSVSWMCSVNMGLLVWLPWLWKAPLPWNGEDSRHLSNAAMLCSRVSSSDAWYLTKRKRAWDDYSSCRYAHAISRMHRLHAWRFTRAKF